MVVVYEVEGKSNGEQEELLVFPTGRVIEGSGDDDEHGGDDDDMVRSPTVLEFESRIQVE